MDQQMIEFWASYKYGIETDLTGSHLDNERAGLNPLLLSPEILFTQNHPRTHIIQPVVVIASPRLNSESSWDYINVKNNVITRTATNVTH